MVDTGLRAGMREDAAKNLAADRCRGITRVVNKRRKGREAKVCALSARKSEALQRRKPPADGAA